jgi:hypothetical protein
LEELVIFCPECAAKLGGVRFPAIEPIVFTVHDEHVTGPRRVAIVYRGQCSVCGAQMVTEQLATQDAEGTWRISSLAQ